jgi:hypothetical protein
MPFIFHYIDNLTETKILKGRGAALAQRRAVLAQQVFGVAPPSGGDSPPPFGGGKSGEVH